jgi:7-keto-8-aminopelargonate synthetase-like enzyme
LKESEKKVKKTKKEISKIQKLKDEDAQFQMDLEHEIDKEEAKRDEQDLGPLKKKDKLLIAENLLKRREEQKDKERLLQFTQKYYVGFGNNFQVVKNAIKSRAWWTPAQSEDF